MKGTKNTQLKLALVNVCQDDERDVGIGARSSGTSIPTIGAENGTGEAGGVLDRFDAGCTGGVELKLSAKRFLIEALAEHDDELARFALAVIRHIVEGESH